VRDQESNPRPHTPRPAALPVKVEQWVKKMTTRIAAVGRGYDHYDSHVTIYDISQRDACGAYLHRDVSLQSKQHKPPDRQEKPQDEHSRKHRPHPRKVTGSAGDALVPLLPLLLHGIVRAHKGLLCAEPCSLQTLGTNCLHGSTIKP